MTFEEAYIEARTNNELVNEYNRLADSSLKVPYQVDDPSHNLDEEHAFIDFFIEYIWLPIANGQFK